MSRPRSYLAIIGERLALRWVLEEQRFGFRRSAAAQTDALSVGDEILLYSTRGCFHSPTRDRGRIIGRAEIASSVAALEPAVEIADLRFDTGCDLRLLSLAPARQGVELHPLVDQLPRLFPDPRSWSMRLRRTLVALGPSEAGLLNAALAGVARAPEESLPSYWDLIPDTR